jgi:saccharopine dehydrogenase-like NADP-dependent oxidoreductase
LPLVKVLVLGGYGNFGATIATRLAADANFEVIVAGRDLARAQAFAHGIGAQPAAVDTHAADFPTRLRDLAPGLVVSTAGPFQGQDYGVARAALAAGAHYIDIADGRAYVCGIRALDGEARAAGRLVIAGASSVPALSSAVVQRLALELDRVEAIEIGISASERTPGPATVEAVLGYCGKRFARKSNGTWIDIHGWQAIRAHAFDDPPMRRWLADCDVPDLDLLPERYPGARDVRFVAGVESKAVMAGMWLLSWVVRLKLMPSAVRLAPGLARAAHVLERFGTGRSAMFVRVTGSRGDARCEYLWELRASDNKGALVPCMAAVALARKLARGALPDSGALPCMGLLDLDEYLAELDGQPIFAQRVR